MVEEDEDEEETVRVGLKLRRTGAKLADISADNTQEIGDVVCQRYAILARFLSSTGCNIANRLQETVLSSFLPKHHHESRIPRYNYGKHQAKRLNDYGHGKYPKGTLQSILGNGVEVSWHLD